VSSHRGDMLNDDKYNKSQHLSQPHFSLSLNFKSLIIAIFQEVNMELAEYRWKARTTYQKIADKVGVSRYYLNSVALGKIKPGYHLCVRIEQFTEGKVTVRELLGPFHDKKEKQFSTCQKAD